MCVHYIFIIIYERYESSYSDKDIRLLVRYLNEESEERSNRIKSLKIFVSRKYSFKFRHRPQNGTTILRNFIIG